MKDDPGRDSCLPREDVPRARERSRSVPSSVVFVWSCCCSRCSSLLNHCAAARLLHRSLCRRSFMLHTHGGRAKNNLLGEPQPPTQVLQWCRQNGCPWGGGTCANSAEGGHLDVLKWARSEGCPWTEATCTLAARENQLEILKWCRENGCNWASSTFR